METASGNNNPAKSYGIYVEGNASSNYTAGYFDGDVYANGLLVSSDLRLKERVQNIDGALAILEQIQPKKYKLRRDSRLSVSNDRDHYGFIAQEMEEVLPDLVEEIHHPAVYEYVDPELDSLTADFRGEPSVPGLNTDERGLHRIETKPAEDLKAIRYVELIAVLAQAVKEQQVQIENLQNLITDSPLSNNASAPSSDDGKTNNALAKYDELVVQLDQLKEYIKSVDQNVIDLRQCTDCGQEDWTTIPNQDDPVTKYTVFPNPASDRLVIKNLDRRPFSARIYTADGLMVTSRHSKSSGLIRINTQSWINGSYIVDIFTPEGELLGKKIVVIAH